MANYSLKRLFVATTLVAVGIGIFTLRLQPALFAISFSGALIGAGILTPVRHPWIGAVVGFISAPCLVVAYALWHWSTYGMEHN